MPPRSEHLTARLAAEKRGAYADAILDMPEGQSRRVELRQMLVDLLDVVEQSADEAQLLAALKAFDADTGAVTTGPTERVTHP